MNKKRIGILLVVCIIVLIIILFIIGNNKKGKKEERLKTGEVFALNNRNDYYIIDNILSRYYAFAYSERALDNEEKQSLIEMLEKNYVEEFNIKTNNLDKLIRAGINPNYFIDTIYGARINNNINMYIVNVVLDNKELGDDNKDCLTVYIDYDNKTFSVAPTEYTIKQKYDKIKIGDTVNTVEKNKIEMTKLNKFNSYEVNDEKYIIDLFEKIKKDLIYHRKHAYNYLHSEYRENRFKTYEEFNTHILGRLDDINQSAVLKYSKEDKDGQTQYIIIDYDLNEYIVYETSVMKYTLVLDSYGILTPEFKTKYDSLENDGKAILNIKRFAEAYNMKDYNFMYDRLNETFKANNFPTIEEFKQYFVDNYYNEIDFENIKNSSEGGVEVFELEILDKNGVDKVFFEQTFIIKIKDNYEFEISFDKEIRR